MLMSKYHGFFCLYLLLFFSLLRLIRLDACILMASLFNYSREIDTLLEIVDLRVALQEENLRCVRESIQTTMKETEKCLDSLDHLNERAKVNENKSKMQKLRSGS